MSKLRIATFNCENLFARFQFRRNIDPVDALIDGWTVNQTKFNIYDETAKSLTALAIKETKADVIALQEVENLDTLRKFRSDYLGGRRAYPQLLVIDGNDPRRIDVGIMSKLAIEGIETHINEYDSQIRYYTFSRDCLECSVVTQDNKRVRLFVNHFKSMFDRRDPCNGRSNTHDRRKAQAKRVREIVEQRVDVDNDDFIILGDLNDYPQDDNQGQSAIKDLIQWDKVDNVIEHLPQTEKWTHYYPGSESCGIPEAYRQLDYMLISKSLSTRNQNPNVEIVRKGMPFRADQYTGERFSGVGLNNPKASDHCPLVVELDV